MISGLKLSRLGTSIARRQMSSARSSYGESPPLPSRKQLWGEWTLVFLGVYMLIWAFHDEPIGTPPPPFHRWIKKKDNVEKK